MKFTSVAFERRALSATAVVLAAMLAWTAAIGWLVTRQYLTFGYDDFDLAHDVQNVWNLLHGSLDSTILGIPWLGNHVSLILFLIAPIYALIPSPLTLLWLQTLALAAGAWPLHLLARALIGPLGAALTVLLYLLNPSLANVALYEFHTEAFAAPALLWMFYALHAERYRQFVVAMVLGLLCKENVPLVVMFIGLLALVSGRGARWWTVPLVAGGGWFLACVLLIGPHFNRGEVGFIGLYAGLGSTGSEIVRTLLFHPWRVGTLLATRVNAVYVAQLLAPVGFLALAAPLYLLTALPILAQHMLSLRATEQTILYHYTAPLLPSILVATVVALRRIGFSRAGRARGAVMAVALLSVAGLSSWFWGAPARLTQPESAPRFAAADAADIVKREMVSHVPPDAAVVATFEFLARLAARPQIYSFHNVVTGKKIISSEDFVLPSTVRWALIDFADPIIFAGNFYWGRPESDARIRRMLTTGTWQTVAEGASVVLFRRADADRDQASDVSDQPAHGVALDRVPELRGWAVGPLRVAAGSRVPIDWYWQLPGRAAPGYWVYVAIVQGNRTLERTQRLALANVTLSDSQLVRERTTLMIPIDLAPGPYEISGFIVRHETGRGTPAGEQLARVSLGTLEIMH